MLGKLAEELLPPGKCAILKAVDDAEDAVDLVLDLLGSSLQRWGLPCFHGSLYMLRNILDVVVLVKNIPNVWEVCLKKSKGIAVAILHHSLYLNNIM